MARRGTLSNDDGCRRCRRGLVMKWESHWLHCLAPACVAFQVALASPSGWLDAVNAQTSRSPPDDHTGQAAGQGSS